MDVTIKLIEQRYKKDSYGVDQPTSSYRTVFARMKSITRAEFAAAGRNGLNPSMVFLVWAGDYRGERVISYEGDSYAVYRTYRPEDDDYIELYCERQGGTNGYTQSQT